MLHFEYIYSFFYNEICLHCFLSLSHWWVVAGLAPIAQVLKVNRVQMPVTFYKPSLH